jgi:hypothetical protein
MGRAVTASCLGPLSIAAPPTRKLGADTATDGRLRAVAAGGLVALRSAGEVTARSLVFLLAD